MSLQGTDGQPPEWQRARDCTVSPLVATLASLAFVVPVGGGLYALFSQRPSWSAPVVQSGTPGPLGLLALFLAGIILHELIHGLTWSLVSGRRGLVKYGVNWAALMPYAHAREPLTARVYRIGAAMPGLLLGLLPAAVGILSGHGLTFYFGLMLTVAAGGDMLILWLLRGTRPNSLVLDHPTRPGCLVLDEPPGPG